jgi:hypothetical protein
MKNPALFVDYVAHLKRNLWPWNTPAAALTLALTALLALILSLCTLCRYVSSVSDLPVIAERVACVKYLACIPSWFRG